MKSVILLYLALVVFNCAAANIVHLSEKQREKSKQYTLECVNETGVRTEALELPSNGQFSEDESFKKFVLCFFNKSGILNSDGTLNAEVALAKLPPGADKVEAQNALEECQDKNGKNAAETAFDIFKCYYKNTKTEIVY